MADLIEQKKDGIEIDKVNDTDSENVKRSVPTGVWNKCNTCGEVIYTKSLHSNHKVCHKCGYHFRLEVGERVNLLVDDGTFVELYENMTSQDPLNFVDLKPYKDRLKEAREKTGRNSAIITGIGLLDGKNIALGVMDFSFLGGSMDSVVGEKIARLVDVAIENKYPVIIVSTSGGARMQESMFSLMQMAKTSAAIARLGEKNLPFISILTDPTTGGVSASFAMLGDINIAEPDALIAFAGPRVIEQTIRQTLPEGFQRSEFLLKHGMIDMIVKREEMKKTLSRILDIFGKGK